MIHEALPETRRVIFRRNKGGFLLGVTWVHYHDWNPRLTHFYLGWWTATLRTRIPALIDGSSPIPPCDLHNDPACPWCGDEPEQFDGQADG